MAKYLLIESRDPLESNAAERHFGIAQDLKKDGNDVTFFLVQNGVFPARRSLLSEKLTELSKAGVEVLADEFSLKERGIDKSKLTDGVKAASLDVVVDRLADGSKTMWL